MVNDLLLPFLQAHTGLTWQKLIATALIGFNFHSIDSTCDMSQQWWTVRALLVLVHLAGELTKRFCLECCSSTAAGTVEQTATELLDDSHFH